MTLQFRWRMKLIVSFPRWEKRAMSNWTESIAGIFFFSDQRNFGFSRIANNFGFSSISCAACTFEKMVWIWQPIQHYLFEMQRTLLLIVIWRKYDMSVVAHESEILYISYDNVVDYYDVILTYLHLLSKSQWVHLPLLAAPVWSWVGCRWRRGQRVCWEEL